MPLDYPPLNGIPPTPPEEPEPITARLLFVVLMALWVLTGVLAVIIIYYIL